MISLPVLLLWLVSAALGLLCLERALRLNRMPLLAVYLAFCALRSLWLGVVAFRGSPIAYWGCYWPFQALGYLLTALLALTLLRSVVKTPGRLIDLQALTSLIVILPFVSCFWAEEWRPWLNVAKWCDVAVIWLLIGALFHVERWRKTEEAIAWGLALGMSGHVVCALLQGNREPGEWLRALYQFMAVLQLAVWLWALCRERDEKEPLRVGAGASGRGST